MKTRIYHIQDSDCPMWVLANNYAEAIEKWKEKMSDNDPENCPTKADVEEPLGVTLVCDEDEVIL